MPGLYYILRAEHLIPDVDIPLSYEVTIDEKISASFSMDPPRLGTALTDEATSDQKETAGSIVVRVADKGSWELRFFLRFGSGLLLLDSSGRAVLRNYGQQAMKEALRQEFEHVPVYSDYLSSMLSDAAVQTHSLKFMRVGEIETWEPHEGPFDWSLLEFHPFVEVKFRLTDNSGRTQEVRITPRTVHVSSGHDNALSAVSQVIEKHLLGGQTHHNANQIC